jgi:RHS repeat-associated protein
MSNSGTSQWPSPTYEAIGNFITSPQPLAPTSGFNLKWDAWNRLVEVKIGSSFVGAYAYDGANRRVTKLTGAEFRQYFYSDQWQILEERTARNNNADRRFFWGTRYVDDLICRDRRFGAETERLYALHDSFNVTAIVDVTGAVQERFGYDAFGTPRYMTASFDSRSSSQFDWETLYAAYRYDLETGLYQVRNRYLHPVLGRWLSRDPISTLEFQLARTNGAKQRGTPPLVTGLNLYDYIFNNSVNQVDSSGLIAPAVILAIIKVLWEGACAAYALNRAIHHTFPKDSHEHKKHCLVGCITNQCSIVSVGILPAQVLKEVVFNILSSGAPWNWDWEESIKDTLATALGQLYGVLPWTNCYTACDCKVLDS